MQWRVTNYVWVENMRCTGNLRPCTHLEVKVMIEHNSTIFRGTGKSWPYVLSPVQIDCRLQIWQSHCRIYLFKAILNSCITLWDTGFMIPGKGEAFAPIWSNFQWTRELLAYVLSRVMTDPATHICQTNWAMKHSERNCLLVSEYETWLAHLSQCHTLLWQILKVEMYQGGLGTYHYNCHCIIGNSIWQSRQFMW